MPGQQQQSGRRAWNRSSARLGASINEATIPPQRPAPSHHLDQLADSAVAALRVAIKARLRLVGGIRRAASPTRSMTGRSSRSSPRRPRRQRSLQPRRSLQCSSLSAEPCRTIGMRSERPFGVALMTGRQQSVGGRPAEHDAVPSRMSNVFDCCRRHAGGSCRRSGRQRRRTATGDPPGTLADVDRHAR